MYRKFTITDFRGFKELEIADLTQVSLLTGRNNVGKTAILEALLLHAGRRNPLLPNRLEQIRGRRQVALNARAIWGWLFRDRRTDRPIELVGEDDRGRQRSLRIELCESGMAVDTAADLTASAAAGSAALPGVGGLQLTYEGEDAREWTSRASIEGNKVKVEVSGPPLPQPCMFLSSRSRCDDDTARRWSAVDAVGKIPQVVDILQHVDPRVRRLSLAYDAKAPTLKVDIGLEELVPIPMVGEGLNRLAQIVLAICESSGGIVLVDEFENGFHSTSLPGIWKGIAYAAGQSDVQVVATTHSLECVRAAADAFEGAAGPELSVYRLDRAADGTRVTRFDRDALAEHAPKALG